MSTYRRTWAKWRDRVPARPTPFTVEDRTILLVRGRDGRINQAIVRRSSTNRYEAESIKEKLIQYLAENGDVPGVLVVGNGWNVQVMP